MKKFILCVITCLTICMSSFSKTRYMAYSTINMSIEQFDSLNNMVPNHMMTHGSYCVKDFGDLQLVAYSMPVSDEESNAIKRAKAAQGWAAFAMVTNAVSAGLNAGAAIGHHGFHHSLYHWNMAAISQINYIQSMGVYEHATKALQNLKDFDGTAITISNNSLEPRVVYVNSEPIHIAPKDSKAIGLHKEPLTIVINDDNKNVTKVKVDIVRDVQKFSYDFERNGMYYSKDYSRDDRGYVYHEYMSDNMQNPKVISKEYYTGMKKNKPVMVDNPVPNNPDETGRYDEPSEYEHQD